MGRGNSRNVLGRSGTNLERRRQIFDRTSPLHSNGLELRDPPLDDLPPLHIPPTFVCVLNSPTT